ncbi:MAG TPA: SH3 domain-containing protein [Anaerolineales bacterium]|nr:SH3 domain-containing protein [Anaerolineales bacterium]HLO28554.1 SH3 domain-containing protein [Anaerolineales bacterium]
MSFKLIYYSQQDPQWKNDILGFGESGDTIGYIGCALTSVSMLLSGHGYAETPKTLNQKLKNVKGFAGASIYWGAVSQVYPHVTVKSNISCSTSEAPLNLIDAAIAAGQPAVVQVDYSNSPGIQTHWVMVYGKMADDYLMLDPWPYQTDVTKPDLLMKRYAQGNPLKRAISHVILYEAYGSGGPIVTSPAGQPTTTSTSTGGASARVKDSVTWGLNIRSSVDTSSLANVVTTVPAGTQLTLLELDGASKIGAINQWVRVRTSQGQEGFAAAWYLENIPGAIPAPVTNPASSPANEVPSATPPAAEQAPSEVSTASTPAGSPNEEKKEDKLIVVVSSAVGASGLRLRKTASKGGDLITVLKAGTRLTVIEPAQKAKDKIGKVNQWLYVRGPNNQRGYVGAEYVTLP